MPAPSAALLQLLNFEDNFETAAQAILADAGIDDSFLPADAEDLPATHIEIQFATGEALNQHTRDDGTLVYDYFDGLLTLRISSLRDEQQPSLVASVRSKHEEFAATARAAFLEHLDPFAAHIGEKYAVRMIKPLATRRDLEIRLAAIMDFTELQFRVQFGIRDTAWPA